MFSRGRWWWCQEGGQPIETNVCVLAIHLPPTQSSPPQGHSSVIRAVIASPGEVGVGGGGPRADPEGRYIYLGNESPNSAARQGGGGEDTAWWCSETHQCRHRGPDAAH